MFNNITKGEWDTYKNHLIINGKVGVQATFCRQSSVMDSYDKDIELMDNVSFSAFCFNLQQKYDISLFEDAIILLNELLESETVNDFYCDKINNLLNHIKQNK